MSQYGLLTARPTLPSQRTPVHESVPTPPRVGEPGHLPKMAGYFAQPAWMFWQYGACDLAHRRSVRVNGSGRHARSQCYCPTCEG